jgi:fructose-bisphosphate aldolase class I
MGTEKLAATAKELVAAGKGILAADESNGTMSRRLESIGVKPGEDPLGCRSHGRDQGR